MFAVAERWQRWACARDRAIVIESTRNFHRPAVVTNVVEYVTPNGRHSERNEIGAGVDIKAIHRVDQSHASDLHEILERFATAGLSAGPV